jgi:dTDP-glucose 4,6-dehydratase
MTGTGWKEFESLLTNLNSEQKTPIDFIMNKTILVTGGAGFIGSNFIHYMLKKHKGYKIINLDKLTYAGNPDNLKDIKGNRNYSFVKGDICDQPLVARLMAKADWVVNFAAESHVDRSIDDPYAFTRTNVIGTHVLLEEARRHKTELFLQIGTDEVYGSVAKGSSKEDDNLDPRSPYSASKAAADLLALSYHTTFGMKVMVTRSSNNFGPYQFPEKLIPFFVTNALQDKPLPIYGDGRNVRDWLYVVDNCAGLDAVLHHGRPGQIYNIGGGNERMNIEITDLILKSLRKPASLKKYVQDRPGHDRRYSLDIAKARKLGWRPEHSFKQAIAQTVEWYVSNQWWWKNIMKRQKAHQEFQQRWYKNRK